MTGLYDPGGRDFPEVQERHLTVTGTVARREVTAGGCRIILHSLSFLKDRSEAYQNTIQVLNEKILPSDRMILFLTDGEETEAGLMQTEDQAWLSASFHTGDTVVLRGKCGQPEKASNPGQFDLRAYYHARNIYFTMRDVQLVRADHPTGSFRTPWYRLCDMISEIRYLMQKGLARMYGEDAPYLAAAILGDKSALTEEQKQTFQDGGLAYLLAVTGLHITLAGKSVYVFLRRMRLSFVCASLISSYTVLLCVLLTGGSVSSLRACVMFVFWLGAQILGRTDDRLTSLSAAAVFILIRQPYALFDSSFQISCVCILSLEIIPAALSKILCAQRLKSVIRTFSIQLGTFPVTLFWYYQVYPFAYLLHSVLSAAAAALVIFALPGSICGIMLSARMPALLETAVHITGQLFAGPCHYLITFYLLICRIEQILPLSVIILGRPHILQIIAYYALLGMFLTVLFRTDRKRLKQNIRRFRVFGLLMPVLLITVISIRKRPDFRYICIDVGQGSCNLLECGRHAYLFDAGSSSVNCIWKYRISPLLRYYGISRLDAVFLSHGDLDHVNGIGQMLCSYHRNLVGNNSGDITVGQVLLPDLPYESESLENIRQMAEHFRIQVGYVSEESDIRCGELELKVLNPSPGRITGNENEDCIVLYAQYGRLHILMTGDLELDGEELFVERYSSGFGENESGSDTCRILVAGHHGSKNATSEKMLDLVKPDMVLISCGRNNRYGHPSGKMLDRLKAYGVKWSRTDLDGAYCISIG